MRRGALKLKDSLQLGFSNTKKISVAAYSTGNKPPEDDTDKRYCLKWTPTVGVYIETKT